MKERDGKKEKTKMEREESVGTEQTERRDRWDERENKT